MELYFFPTNNPLRHPLHGRPVLFLLEGLESNVNEITRKCWEPLNIGYKFKGPNFYSTAIPPHHARFLF